MQRFIKKKKKSFALRDKRRQDDIGIYLRFSAKPSYPSAASDIVMHFPCMLHAFGHSERWHAAPYYVGHISRNHNLKRWRRWM